MYIVQLLCILYIFFHHKIYISRFVMKDQICIKYIFSFNLDKLITIINC